MSIGNRSGVQASNCPVCAVSGFKDSKPGYVYLLRHEQWGLLKIGITNEPEVRLHTHGQLGFEVLEISSQMSGAKARSTEKQIKEHLSAAGVMLGPSPVRRQFNGWTECWFEDTFPVSSIAELLQR
jgi:hypothetical protein